MRVVRFQSGALELVAEPRDEAHGELLWSLPKGDKGEALFTLDPFGDVRKDALPVLRAGGEAGAAFEAQRAEWRRAERAFAPEVTRLMRGARSAPGAWEVCAGLFLMPLRTPTLPPATHTNGFFVGEPGGAGLFIEPAPSDRLEIARIIETAEILELRIEAIAITHHHPDHAAGARVLAKHWKVPLCAHARTGELLDLALDQTLEEGARLLGLMRTYHTPGHAEGHLCFLHEPSGTLIAGDMVAGVGTILIEPNGGDMNRYLHELERLVGVGRWLLPAHGGLVLDGPGLLQRTAAHRRARDAKVARALSANAPCRAEALLPEVYADVPQALHPLALRSLLAHLEAMVARGEASVDDEHVFRR